MEDQIVIPPDPSMTGPEPETTTPPVSEPETAPDAEASPGAEDPDEVESEGQEEPPADPEFKLPDGTTIKASEIAALKSAPAAPSPAEQKLADLEAKLAKIEGERAQAEQQRQEQQRANTIMPDTNPDRWKQARYQQYVDAYKAKGLDPEQIDWRDIENDHTRAMVNVLREQTTAREQAASAREAEATVERERLWLERTVGSFIGQEKYALANTDEARDDINAHLQVVLNQTGQITSKDVEAAVAKVHGRAHAIVSAYVNKKKKNTGSTIPTSRSGGTSRAPEAKRLPAELGSIRQLGNDIAAGKI